MDITTDALLKKIDGLEEALQIMVESKVEIEAELEIAENSVVALTDELIASRGKWTEAINEKSKLRAEIEELETENRRVTHENEIVYKSIGSLQKEMSTLRWELTEANKRETYANEQWGKAAQSHTNSQLQVSTLLKDVDRLYQEANSFACENEELTDGISEALKERDEAVKTAEMVAYLYVETVIQQILLGGFSTVINIPVE